MLCMQVQSQLKMIVKCSKKENWLLTDYSLLFQSVLEEAKNIARIVDTYSENY